MGLRGGQRISSYTHLFSQNVFLSCNANGSKMLLCVWCCSSKSSTDLQLLLYFIHFAALTFRMENEPQKALCCWSRARWSRKRRVKEDGCCEGRRGRPWISGNIIQREVCLKTEDTIMEPHWGFLHHGCHFPVAHASCLEDVVKHRCGAEMTTQHPFILLSDRMKTEWD